MTIVNSILFQIVYIFNFVYYEYSEQKIFAQVINN